MYVCIILLMQFQASDVTHRLICYSSVSYGQERPHSSGKIFTAPVKLSALEKLFYLSIQNMYVCLYVCMYVCMYVCNYFFIY